MDKSPLCDQAHTSMYTGSEEPIRRDTAQDGFDRRTLALLVVQSPAPVAPFLDTDTIPEAQNSPTGRTKEHDKQPAVPSTTFRPPKSRELSASLVAARTSWPSRRMGAISRPKSRRTDKARAPRIHGAIPAAAAAPLTQAQHPRARKRNYSRELSRTNLAGDGASKKPSAHQQHVSTPS